MRDELNNPRLLASQLYIDCILIVSRFSRVQAFLRDDQTTRLQ